jgi:hypothetical protein
MEKEDESLSMCIQVGERGKKKKKKTVEIQL